MEKLLQKSLGLTWFRRGYIAKSAHRGWSGRSSIKSRLLIFANNNVVAGNFGRKANVAFAHAA